MTVRVDIMLALIPYQLEALKRRVYLKIFNIKMPVLTPEDLIIHKLISNRSIDVQDVEHIFKYNIKHLDLNYLLKWAKNWGIKERV